MANAALPPANPLARHAGKRVGFCLGGGGGRAAWRGVWQIKEGGNLRSVSSLTTANAEFCLQSGGLILRGDAKLLQDLQSALRSADFPLAAFNFCRPLLGVAAAGRALYASERLQERARLAAVAARARLAAATARPQEAAEFAENVRRFSAAVAAAGGKVRSRRGDAA